MTFVPLFVTATKLAGAIVTIVVAANAFSFSSFKRKNLRSFRSPIDESSDVLADFNVDEEKNGFFFGLATAPAHVEDRLNDAWIQFAEEQKPDDDSLEVKQQADALMGSASGDGGSHQAASSRQHEDSTVKKRKKPLKVAMEAMIRGFEKYSEENEVAPAAVPEEQQHNVTAWHNVPHP